VVTTYESRGWATGQDSVKAYQNFREVLARDDVDAVLIATPAHWHSLLTIKACEAGKDVYCEKPLSLSVADNHAVFQAVRRYNRIFQHGTQWATGDPAGTRKKCEQIRSGRNGIPCFETEAWTTKAPEPSLDSHGGGLPND
jgi:predicted dehydrogenase